MDDGMKLAENPPETPRKGCGDASQRVATSRVEYDTTERNNQNITGVSRRVACDADHDDHRRQEAVAGDVEQSAQSGVNKAGCFRDTDTEHRNEHDTDGVKVREVRDHD